ncbi:hypothetical protein [Nitrospira sp. BLG_1]|uniref:hypothetical protein n=1 Tax=Nitrospira sp. BLG_1 TaxID=3395883 RepID=UPI0039BD66F5
MKYLISILMLSLTGCAGAGSATHNRDDFSYQSGPHIYGHISGYQYGNHVQFYDGQIGYVNGDNLYRSDGTIHYRNQGNLY